MALAIFRVFLQSYGMGSWDRPVKGVRPREGAGSRVTCCLKPLAAADMLSMAADGPFRGPSCSRFAPLDSAPCSEFPCTGAQMSYMDTEGAANDPVLYTSTQPKNVP